MQLGGIHGADNHQVTECIHEHAHNLDKKGGSAAASSVGNQMTQFRTMEQQEMPFSFTGWMQKVLTGGRKFWRGIWGTNEAGTAGESGSRSNTDGISGQTDVGNGISATTLRTSAIEKQVQPNPYFQPVERKPVLQAMSMQRVRGKLRAAAGKLAEHLPGKFSGFHSKGSFQTKQQRSGEDLSKRSRYKRDDLEIDCILTDESYLLDSYNKNGEYSKLTTKT